MPGTCTIEGPTAWTAGTVDGAVVAWPVTVDELLAAGAHAEAPELAARPVPALVEAVHPAADALLAALGRGPGFVRAEPLPVDRLGEGGVARVVTALLAAWGRPIVQNLAGDLLYEVRDRVGSADPAYGSRGAGELLPHTDQAAAPPERLPDLLVMCGLTRAAEGGATRLLSGHEAHNRVLAADEDLVARLTSPLWFARNPDGTADDAAVRAPVFAGAGRATRVRYNRFFLGLGAEEAGVGPTDAQREALDALDAVLDDGELVHETMLEPGELLLVDNHVVLHDRTPFVDVKPAVRRLLRGWVRTNEMGPTTDTGTRGMN